MNIRENETVRVFDIKEHENRKNTMVANLSSFEGRDQSGEAIYSSWYTYFVGEAFEKAKSLENGDRIELSNAKVSKSYNKETKTTYVNVTVFDFGNSKSTDK